MGDESDDFQTIRHKKSYLRRMQREIGKLMDASEYKPGPDDLSSFFELFRRYLDVKDKKIDWSKIRAPPTEKINRYEDLSETKVENRANLLRKLAVLKLNGGLGTTMGCDGPKSAIKVKGGDNFIDVCVRQISCLNKSYGTNVPLIFMNSFNTNQKTDEILCKYEDDGTLIAFNQSVHPRIYADTLLPVPANYGDAAVCPPGHGDLFESLKRSGTLDSLLKDGKEYIFVSNVDNLAANVDLKILEHIVENDIDFLMEVTDKTRADVKGGTLIEYDGRLRLLEIAQVPDEERSSFLSVRKFKIFNTNSVWINLAAIKRILDSGALELEIIENRKRINGISRGVIQLETALGDAIRFFPHSCGLVVPRTRFLPVKSCSDLLLVKSDIYLEEDGVLRLSPKRIYPNLPLIKLQGDNFADVESFNSCFKTIPNILDLDYLTVSGNVRFGRNVTLIGNVTIIADDNSVIDIPDGSILEDKIVYGNLPIIEN